MYSCGKEATLINFKSPCFVLTTFAARIISDFLVSELKLLTSLEKLIHDVEQLGLLKKLIFSLPGVNLFFKGVIKFLESELR